MAFDVQTIAPRTMKGNLKILSIVDTFSRYVRTKAIPDERAETIARMLIEGRISVFGSMELLLSDGEPNLVEDAAKNLRDTLRFDRTQAYAFHPQANGTVERWNRTLARDLAWFLVRATVTGMNMLLLLVFGTTLVCARPLA